jgi:hypothetical protein
MTLSTPLHEADATIVATGILSTFNAQNRFGQLTNSNYTGQVIGKGSTVKIVSIGDITMSDYIPGESVISPESVTDSAQFLTVNQAKSFAFQVDDVDAALGAGAYLMAASEKAGTSTAAAVDAFYARVISEGAGINVGDYALGLDSPASAYKALIDIRTALADSGQSWSVVVPSDFYGMLLQDPRFVGAGFTAQFNGQVGTVVGGSVIESNTRPGEILAVAGSDSVSSVTAVAKVERYRPESSFSDAVKGLIVYGAKVIRPGTVVKATYTIG